MRLNSQSELNITVPQVNNTQTHEPEQVKQSDPPPTQQPNRDQLNHDPSKTDSQVDKKPLPLFKTEAEQGTAERYLNRFSGNAFDPTRTIDDQFINLRTFHDMYEKDPAFMGQLSSVDFNSSGDKGTIDLEDLGGITNLDEMKEQFVNSLKKNGNAQSELGADGDYEAYLKENVNGIAQQLGSDLSDNYEGFVSMIGDVDSFSSLNARGGVCSDIHAAITAFRTSMGQESYMVMTSGSDAAHVFNVFKDEGKWYIQNYGKIVETEAQTLSELYDIAMPEQRKIRVYGIDDDGNPEQVLTDHLTRTGRAERRFNNELGTGTFSPWHTQEGVHITSQGATIYKDGFYAQANALARQGAIGYYSKSSDEEGTTKIHGFSIQGRYDNNAQVNGKHIDAKYESEKRWVTHNTFGRQHFSVRAGYVGKEDEPVYWQNDLETTFNDPAAQDETPHASRIGINYERNGSKVYGDKPVKFELGYQTKVGTTVTFNASSPLEYDFVGRIYGDAVGEAKMVTGVFY